MAGLIQNTVFLFLPTVPSRQLWFAISLYLPNMFTVVARFMTHNIRTHMLAILAEP